MLKTNKETCLLLKQALSNPECQLASCYRWGFLEEDAETQLGYKILNREQELKTKGKE